MKWAPSPADLFLSCEVLNPGLEINFSVCYFFCGCYTDQSQQVAASCHEEASGRCLQREMMMSVRYWGESLLQHLQSVLGQSLSCVQLSATPWTVALLPSTEGHSDSHSPSSDCHPEPSAVFQTIL